MAVAILRKKSDNCFNLGIPRFAKMRLERIEKMGVEMIEILPQVKFLIFILEEMGLQMIEILPQVSNPHHIFTVMKIMSSGRKLSDVLTYFSKFLWCVPFDQAYMDCYELCLVQNEKEIAEIFANR